MPANVSSDMPVEDRIKDTYRAMICEMPLGKITVSSLCERVGVSRKTFYTHFTDLEAVLDAVLSDDLIEPLSKIYPLSLSMGEDVSSRLLNELSYKSLLTHKDFYLHIVTRNEERLFVRALQRCLRKAQDYANVYLGDPEHDEQYEYASRFLAAGQAAIILNWIRTGMDTPTSSLGEWFNTWSLPALQAMAGRDD